MDTSDKGKGLISSMLLDVVDPIEAMAIAPWSPPAGVDLGRCSVSVGELRIANLRRAAMFHGGGVEAWSPLQWATCVVGEVGEVFNARKKVWRGDGRVEDLLEELADVAIYTDLLLARVNASWSLSYASLDVLATQYAAWKKPQDCTQDLWFMQLIRESTFAYQHARLGEVRGMVRCGEVIFSSAVGLIRVLGASPDRVIAQKFNATSRARGVDVFIGGNA